MERSKTLIRNTAAVFITLIGSGIWISCTSPPRPLPQATEAEKIEKTRMIGDQLARGVEPYLKIKTNKEVSVYLRRMAETLSKGDPELQTAPLGVWVVEDIQKKWMNFGLPGIRIYLSLGLLRTLEYENELAAVIAFQLAHVARDHLVGRLSARTENIQNISGSSDLGLSGDKFSRAKLSRQDLFGPAGIFAFTEGEDLEALHLCTQILYRAGFDPRGVVTLLKKYQNNIEQSPYDADLLSKFIQQVQNDITISTPLRNPIVKTADFVNMQKRVQKL